MKKILLSVFLFLFSFTTFTLLAQNTTPNVKLLKANEKVAYHIENSRYEYEEIVKMPYDLPWSGYEQLNAFKIKEIQRFLKTEKEMKGKNIFYLAFSIIYQEYEKGNVSGE